MAEHTEAVLGLRTHFRDVCERRVLEIALDLAGRGHAESTAAQMALLKFAPERVMIRCRSGSRQRTALARQQRASSFAPELALLEILLPIEGG